MRLSPRTLEDNRATRTTMKKLLLLIFCLTSWNLSAQMKPIEKLKVSKGPYFTSLSPDGRRLYVTCYADSEIQVIDTVNNRADRTFYGGYEPVGIAASPDGEKLFVTSMSGGLVKVINARNYEIMDDVKVAGRPVNVVVAPSGLQAYVLNLGRGKIGRVDFLDAGSHRIQGEVEIGIRPVQGVLSRLGDRLFVVCSASNDLYAIDVNRREVITKIGVGRGPDGIALSADGLQLYVANSVSDDLSVIDLLDMKEVRRVKVGSKPFSIAVGPKGRIFVVETGDRQVGVYDSDFKKLTSLEARKKPVDVTVSGDGRFAYVTDEMDNHVFVYQLP